MKSKAWIKFFHYEYWPMWAFYLPLIPYAIMKGLLKGNLFYFTNANPGIDEYGGLFFDSKNDIDEKFPQQFKPKSILIKPFTNDKDINTFIENLSLELPLIIKPDNGERGKGVVKIYNYESLYLNLKKINCDYLVQEYIDFDLEYGVFVVYDTEIKKFKITSLTEKKYFRIIGNGEKNIEELILETQRGVVFFNELKNNSDLNFQNVPLKNESVIIHTHGNHCKGTQFINRTSEISVAMNEKFNELMSNLNGLYYGRFDIKIREVSDLETFNKLKIIEFNGIPAEPIHIYDESIGYINSLKIFIHHWQYLDKISLHLKSLGFKQAKSQKVIKKLIKLL